MSILDAIESRAARLADEFANAQAGVEGRVDREYVETLIRVVLMEREVQRAEEEFRRCVPTQESLDSPTATIDGGSLLPICQVRGTCFRMKAPDGSWLAWQETAGGCRTRHSDRMRSRLAPPMLARSDAIARELLAERGPQTNPAFVVLAVMGQLNAEFFSGALFKT